MAKQPMAEANRISQMLNMALSGEARFPVNVKEVALELSRSRYADEPIVDIVTLDIDGFEGMLVRHSSGRKWKIGYNSQIQSQGRIRFTLAHEFGHYILHRELREKFQCTQKDMHEWDLADRDIEAQADVFASYLLMPLDDFRQQIKGQTPSIDMLRHCSERYGVSLMAAALKWTEIASKRVVVLAVRDEFVLWARSSKSAYRSGVFLSTRQSLVEVPNGSALRSASVLSDPQVSTLEAKHWFPNEPAGMELVEHAYAVEGYYPYTLGILVLPDAEPRWDLPEDELLTPVDEVFRERM